MLYTTPAFDSEQVYPIIGDGASASEGAAVAVKRGYSDQSSYLGRCRVDESQAGMVNGGITKSELGPGKSAAASLISRPGRVSSWQYFPKVALGKDAHFNFAITHPSHNMTCH